MSALVIYDSKFGNTERIAEAIGRGAGVHGSVRVLSVEAAAGAVADRPDLLLIGGPTQRRGASAGLRAFLDALTQRDLERLPAAAFDTRYRGTTLIMGSAAAETSKRLAKAGARIVAPAESFFIARKGPMESQQLEAGELVRAEMWGREVGAEIRPGQQVA